MNSAESLRKMDFIGTLVSIKPPVPQFNHHAVVSTCFCFIYITFASLEATPDLENQASRRKVPNLLRADWTVARMDQQFLQRPGNTNLELQDKVDNPISFWTTAHKLSRRILEKALSSLQDSWLIAASCLWLTPPPFLALWLQKKRIPQPRCF